MRVPTLAAGAMATLTAHVPVLPMWSRPVIAPLISLRLEYVMTNDGHGVPPRRVMQDLGRHCAYPPNPNADDAVADPRTKLAPHQLLHSVTIDVTLANIPKAVPLTTVVYELLARIDPDALHLQIVPTDHDAWRVVSRDCGRRDSSLLVADIRPSPVAHARLIVGSMSAHTLANTVAHWVRDGSLRVADGFVRESEGGLHAEKRLGGTMLGVLDSASLPDMYREVAELTMQYKEQSERSME
ncbi:hypothetical protein AMAG_02767 [Allomyces macrogynus ATCC 38327]|uniref:Uncharacterized protein n=1 Tax=Allomyces macrogynus (strain ATCC 38327) TaxID=578462 RepID=A0A0L0S397_ALLM3|nr:hypothetical protein AMAG_02767 [Allomyces macrogynus ATCC 38327]|eukprot:KNE57007.1 hypothetical protein AMAG_02767 [Allomyces macrogynus ATCC 38327]